MVTPVIVVLDEARDPGFEITRQVIVLEQNAVLERLVPALDILPWVCGWHGAPRTWAMPRSFSHSAKQLADTCGSARHAKHYHLIAKHFLALAVC